MVELVCVGALLGAFGVRGEVRLKSFCAPPEAIADYAPLCTEDKSRDFSVLLTGQTKGALTARLGGIANKEAADALKGTRLYAPRDRLPDLPENEFYHTDLIGLAVLDTGGQPLGKIRAVHDHGAGDLLEVHGPGLKHGVLLPFTKEAVPTVDITAGQVIADPPDGLFPDE
ncbi:MAG: ribosome maturation factor RimM [Pseudomonadota bacterium]